VYDALVSERCYKKAMTHEEAMEILMRGAGGQFDEEILKTLLEVEEQFKECANLR